LSLFIEAPGIYLFYTEGFLFSANFFKILRLPFAGSSIKQKHLKKQTMKKLLFVAIIGTLVACGESSTSTTTTDTAAVVVDSPKVMVDSPKVDSPKVDSPKVDSPKVKK
jgi:hypothetical protein